MLRFCGLLNFLILLSSVPTHPMMMGDMDATISPLSMDMSTEPSVQENATPADEHVTSTSRPSVEESDITTVTMTHAPTTAAAQLGSATDMTTTAQTEPKTTLSNVSPSIIGMTTFFETPTTTSVMDNKIEEPTTTTHLTPASELTTMVPAVETNSIVPPDTPSETITTNSPVTLPATTTMMTMTTSKHDTNEILKPPGDTVSMAVPTTTLSPLLSLFGFNSSNDLAGFNEMAGPNKVDGQDEVDNVLTMSSNDDTTKMGTSTDSKMDGGDKQTAPVAAVTEPQKSQETDNELDSNGKSDCNSISTSLALLSLAVFYVIV